MNDILYKYDKHISTVILTLFVFSLTLANIILKDLGGIDIILLIVANMFFTIIFFKTIFDRERFMVELKRFRTDAISLLFGSLIMFVNMRICFYSPSRYGTGYYSLLSFYVIVTSFILYFLYSHICKKMKYEFVSLAAMFVLLTISSLVFENVIANTKTFDKIMSIEYDDIKEIDIIKSNDNRTEKTIDRKHYKYILSAIKTMRPYVNSNRPCPKIPPMLIFKLENDEAIQLKICKSTNWEEKDVYVTGKNLGGAYHSEELYYALSEYLYLLEGD